ncbi:hypothetical protein AHF37_09961 [Paragonimus kellicotti]|nr:hypothetical protein AHF37_09961 [Paragonimus kellicotti]
MSLSTAKDMQAVALLLKSILLKGGFRLTKFYSNVEDAFTDIPKEDLSSVTVNLDRQQTEAQKALGVVWDSQSDNIRFKVLHIARELRTLKAVDGSKIITNLWVVPDAGVDGGNTGGGITPEMDGAEVKDTVDFLEKRLEDIRRFGDTGDDCPTIGRVMTDASRSNWLTEFRASSRQPPVEKYQ